MNPLNELSHGELKTISNSEFFRLKREITHKIEGSFAMLGESIAEILQNHVSQIPHDLLEITPKISQGERYLGLPWLILDYPRVFSGEDVFAFRSMFWWGNYFSFTIHISGKYLEPLKRRIAGNISMLQNRDFYLCINQDPWQHNFEKTNYKLLDKLEAGEVESVLMNGKFMKLSRKFPLDKLSKMTDYGVETYKEFMRVLPVSAH